MNEVRCPKCNKLAGKANGKFKLVADDYDYQTQCYKCKTKLNIKLERL